MVQGRSLLAWQLNICYTACMSVSEKHIIVVGGGASGLMAAGVAAARDCQVVLLERNRVLGRKLLISGKGRCNITNDTDIAGLEKNIPGNARFLRPAFYRFTPRQVMAFFVEHGVPCKTERGGRVFPESDNSADVVRALERRCRYVGVEIRLGVHVHEVLVADNCITGVRTDAGDIIHADAVILATGGSSYPGTGSKGDGYRFCANLGHTIVPIRPSLVPLETEESWPKDVQGLSLRHIRLSACDPSGRKLFSEVGEMLFTHFGVSGPLVLTASRYVSDMPGSHLLIDLKPGLDESALDARLLRDFAKYRRREFINALGDLLPRSLVPILVDMAGIPPQRFVHLVTRAERLAFGYLIKHLPLTVKSARDFAEAIVTAGGVSTREIDPRSLESRLVSNLFLTGEVIDVDGFTGGYNLQIAWATGYLAGESA